MGNADQCGITETELKPKEEGWDIQLDRVFGTINFFGEKDDWKLRLAVNILCAASCMKRWAKR